MEKRWPVSFKGTAGGRCGTRNDGSHALDGAGMQGEGVKVHTLVNRNWRRVPIIPSILLLPDRLIDMLRIPQQPMRRFGRDVFEAAGSSAEEAGIVADHLVEASLMGHDSHGVIRISKYVDWVRGGQVLPNQHIEIVNDRGALLVVDGRFGFGQVIGKEAMDLAADRAVAQGM